MVSEVCWKPLLFVIRNIVDGCCFAELHAGKPAWVIVWVVAFYVDFLLVWGEYCFFLWILTTLHFFFFPAGILTHCLLHHWHTERLMSTRWNITEVIWSMKDIIRLYYYEFIRVCFSEFLKYFFGNCDVLGCRQWSKGVALGLKLTVIVQIVDW